MDRCAGQLSERAGAWLGGFVAVEIGIMVRSEECREACSVVGYCRLPTFPFCVARLFLLIRGHAPWITKCVPGRLQDCEK